MRFQSPYKSADRVGPPPPSMLFVVFPAQRMELGAKGGEGLPERLDWLGKDRNGSDRSRHLLPISAFPPPANPKRVLKAQENFAFPQVRRGLHPGVARL
jgi:hypothetical protein